MLLGGLSAVAIFVAVSSLVVWVAGGRAPATELRLARLGAASRRGPLDAPFAERMVLPLLDGLSRAFLQLLPHSLVARTAKQLDAAGRPMATRAFFTTVLLVPLVILGAGFLVLLAAFKGSPPFTAVLAYLLVLLVGALLPFLWLRRKARNRKLAVWKSLPDALDLMTVSVEAGLGLDAALRQVADKLKGPLAEEIGHALREIGMGRARREALEEMADRVDVPELATFINAVVQAELLGTSLGRVLRAQAQTVRVHRRQRAEEMARKAPVKMVFPLVLCIMPSFFIVVLGPILIHLINYLNE